MYIVNKNFSTKKLTTIKTGGKAKFYVTVLNKNDLVSAFEFVKGLDLNVFVLGGGSNVLINDQLKNYAIIHIDFKKVTVVEQNVDKFVINSGAGKNWDKLVERTVNMGLQGIECMSGIPGTVGAAPIQNIGAYGQELSDVFLEVEAYDTHKSEFVILSKKDCEFGYRDSIFKSKFPGRYIIWSVSIKLLKNKKSHLEYKSLMSYLEEKEINNPSLIETRNAVIAVRESKLPNPEKIPNSGSFFKNPIVDKEKVDKLIKKYPDMPSYRMEGGRTKLYAGWLIEKCGFKGKKIGKVKVFKNNALVLTNPSRRATAVEVKKAADEISDSVKDEFGVTLEPEVRFLGF